MLPFLFLFNFSNIFLSGLIFFLVLFFLVFGIILFIVYLVAKWKLFEKTREKGWKALIPFYSTYILMVEICGLHWIFFALYIVGLMSRYSTLASILILSMSFYNLAKKFNRRTTLTAILSLIFAPFIVILYGFSKDHVYDDKIKVSNCGYFNQI